VDRSDIENFLAAGSSLGVSGLVKEETTENTQFNQSLTSSKLCKEKDPCMSNISRTSDPNKLRHNPKNGFYENYELLEQSDTGKKYTDFEHSLEPTVLIDYTKQVGFEMGEVYDFTPAHIEGTLNKKKLKCDKCDFTATKKGSLTEHKRTEHGALTFKCDQCSYEVSKDKYLTAHNESRHQGIRHECDKCDFKASRKSTLVHHKQVRHEGKWKKCENCDYKAGTRSGLIMHIMSKHKGVRYYCDQCDHVATQERGLKVHKKRHEANEASQPLHSKNF
jgi:predicted RNA-binding Zn-ribbon protein involved in translation (DUF1610 family)